MLHDLPITVKRYVYDSLEDFTKRTNIHPEPLTDAEKQWLSDNIKFIKTAYVPCEFHQSIEDDLLEFIGELHCIFGPTPKEPEISDTLSLAVAIELGLPIKITDVVCYIPKSSPFEFHGRKKLNPAVKRTKELQKLIKKAGRDSSDGLLSCDVLDEIIRTYAKSKGV